MSLNVAKGLEWYKKAFPEAVRFTTLSLTLRVENLVVSLIVQADKVGTGKVVRLFTGRWIIYLLLGSF